MSRGCSIEATREITRWFDNTDPTRNGATRETAWMSGSSGSRILWDGNTIYSYGYHFRAACRLVYNGAWFAFINPETGRSKTTDSHLRELREQACRRGYVIAPLGESGFPRNFFETSSGVIGELSRAGARAEASHKERLRNVEESLKQFVTRRRREEARSEKLDAPWIREVIDLLRSPTLANTDDVIKAIQGAPPYAYKDIRKVLHLASALIVERNNATVKNFGVLGSGRNLATAQEITA